MKQFQKYWKILAIVIGASIGVLAIYYYFNPLTPKLEIRNQTFTVEYAVTENEKRQGLSGRDKLPDNHGMIFVYRDKQQYSFWMKDMKFALDFIWIDDTKIVDITENVPPPLSGKPPETVSPKQPVNRILEVNAGTVERLGIQIGDTVTFLRK